MVAVGEATGLEMVGLLKLPEGAHTYVKGEVPEVTVTLMVVDCPLQMVTFDDMVMVGATHITFCDDCENEKREKEKRNERENKNLFIRYIFFQRASKDIYYLIGSAVRKVFFEMI